MDFVVAIETGRQALMLVLVLAGPILLGALVTGLFIGVLQAVVHVQEQTLTFVPKIFVVLGIIILLLPWMMRILVDYASDLVRNIPQLLGG